MKAMNARKKMIASFDLMKESFHIDGEIDVMDNERTCGICIYGMLLERRNFWKLIDKCFKSIDK